MPQPPFKVSGRWLGLLLLLGAAGPVHSQLIPWRHGEGTNDHPASAFAIYPSNPDTVYALGDFWLMRSVNHGVSWDSVNDNIHDTYGAILVHPTNSHVLLSTRSNGDYSDLFRSTDGGQTWTQKLTGQSVPGTVLEPSPDDPFTIYAGMGARFLFRTTDFGEHWDTLPRPLPGNYIQSLSISASKPGVMYLGTSNTVLRSTDAGLSWVDKTPPLPVLPGGLVRVDPRDENVVYLGVRSLGLFPGGMYKTTNGGTAWFEINNGLSGGDWEVLRLLIHPRCPDTLFLALHNENHVLFRTTNAGASWEPFDLGIPRTGDISLVSGLAFHSATNRFFAGGGTSLQDSSGIFYLDLVSSVDFNTMERPAEKCLSVFPNPAREEIHVRFSRSAPETPTFTLFNVIGQKIGAERLGMRRTGEGAFTVRFTDLPAGVYFLQLLTSAWRGTTRLILTR